MIELLLLSAIAGVLLLIAVVLLLGPRATVALGIRALPGLRLELMAQTAGARSAIRAGDVVTCGSRQSGRREAAAEGLSPGAPC